jgi:hypothetical protein
LIENRHSDDDLGLVSMTKAKIRKQLLMLDQMIEKSASCSDAE